MALLGGITLCPIVLAVGARGRDAGPAASATDLVLPAPSLSLLAAGSAIPADPLARRLAYTWTANAANDNWNNMGNWSSSGGGYPDDCNDDATIPAGTWDIVVTGDQIDDMNISGNVDFSAGSPSLLLEAESYSLSGSSDITLTFSSCTVKTSACP